MVEYSCNLGLTQIKFYLKANLKISLHLKFIEHYNSRRKQFEDDKKFTLIRPTKSKIVWPDSSGVYVIWKLEENRMESLIYVGMTGKFSRNKESGAIRFNEKSFKSRTERWTPYRFSESIEDENFTFHFRFGPKNKNTSEQSKIKNQADAYRYSIPYENLVIHCFHINSKHPEFSPSLLEADILTKFLKITGDLPPANNSL